MKPKEFDDLVRQVFDQNDFEYSPANWDKLTSRMDNKPGKNRHIFWIPLTILGTVASIAASIAMIITLPTLLQNKNTTPLAHVTERPAIQINTIDHLQELKDNDTHIPLKFTASSVSNDVVKTETSANTQPETFALQMPAGEIQLKTKKATIPPALNTFNSSYSSLRTNKLEYKKQAIADNHFRMDYDEQAYAHKTMISISSGINYGLMLSGYAICATGKRMISNRFYLEGDIAFVSNTTTERTYSSSSVAQKTGFQSYYQNNSSSNSSTSSSESYVSNQGMTSTAPPPVTPQGGGTSSLYSTARHASAMRIAGDNSAGTNTYAPVDKTPAAGPVAPLGPDIRESNYSLYYAQVSPSVGYAVNNVFSIGVGGDFQRLLIDGKSVSGMDNAGNSREIPLMDVGLIGKSEMSINRKIKAGLTYRQGFNNILNGSNRYVDRTYLQVQLKYMIFRK